MRLRALREVDCTLGVKVPLTMKKERDVEEGGRGGRRPNLVECHFQVRLIVHLISLSPYEH